MTDFIYDFFYNIYVGFAQVFQGSDIYFCSGYLDGVPFLLDLNYVATFLFGSAILFILVFCLFKFMGVIFKR